MDAVLRPLDLSRVPANFITMMLQSMSLSDRFSCALVCKAWAQEAAAATRSIILRDRVQDLSCLQRWLEKYGHQLAALQLHVYPGSAVLTALPCPQLQDLLLSGSISLDSRVWSDIASATKLASVTLHSIWTESQQADVVSALTALPDLEQLTWSRVRCGQQWGLSDSMLLRKLTKLTAIRFDDVRAAAGLEHLGLLTRLQYLSLAVPDQRAAAGCPGLQELKALTRLEVWDGFDDIPPSFSQLTALQQLHVSRATLTALNQLSALTGPARVGVRDLVGLSPASPPLQLPNLQHFEVAYGRNATMPMSLLGSCTQLFVLKLCSINLSPGSLDAISMLQHLDVSHCRVSAADGAADPVSWQQVFPGPGRLPHLTSLRLIEPEPDLRHVDIECVVA